MFLSYEEERALVEALKPCIVKSAIAGAARFESHEEMLKTAAKIVGDCLVVAAKELRSIPK